MRVAVATVLVIVALVLPSAAVANSGSITNVLPTTGGQFTATYTTTSDRCDAGDVYCGWFPYATQVAPNEPCDPYNTTGRLTYVGQVQGLPGTQGPTTSTFFPKSTGAFKLCLHISYGTYDEVNAAEVIYSPPSPPPVTAAPIATPEPTPLPVPAGPIAPPLSIREAHGYVPHVLRLQYGDRYSNRKGSLSNSCYRLTVQKVRCRVKWVTATYSYKGTVTLQNATVDPADKYSYDSRIDRKRRHKAPAGQSPSRSCDPNYAGACLRPDVSDYDCAGGSGDGPYYTGPVRVVGNDRYGLDRDGDGIACEA